MKEEVSVSFAEVRTADQALKGALNNLEQEVSSTTESLTAELDSVKGMMASRPETKNVNQSLLRLSEAVDAKFNVIEDLVQQKPDMPLAVIGSRDGGGTQVSTAIGRWIYKGGTLDASQGNKVPWTHQACNTSPSAFHWAPGARVITIAMPGLYEVTAGFFFYSQSPRLELLVNDEVVLTGTNGAIKGGDALLSSISPRSRNPSTVGCTLLDFVSLPANATVSVLFHGGAGSEGFIGLRKM